jgi:hypothetical protein
MTERFTDQPNKSRPSESENGSTSVNCHDLRSSGEDEADRSRGTVSYVSPLAWAVLTHELGENGYDSCR